MGNLGGWCSHRGTSDFLQALLEIKQGLNLDISIKTLVNILPRYMRGREKVYQEAGRNLMFGRCCLYELGNIGAQARGGRGAAAPASP